MLPAVAKNLEKMAELLKDPEVWGLPTKHVKVVLDAEAPDDVLDVLLQASRDAKDGLVFYYAGHGIVEPDTFNLFLTIPSTGTNPIHRAIRYEDVCRMVVAGVQCRSRVVLLDCCYSGLAMGGALSPGGRIAERVAIDGSYVLTATAATRQAVAPDGAQYTAFTGALIEILEQGLPAAGDPLDMEAIYWGVRSRLESRAFPAPQALSRNSGHAIAFAHNRARTHRRANPAGPPVGPPSNLPDGFERAPWLPPARLAALIEELRLDGQADTADDIVAVAGLQRDAQEIAAVVQDLADRAMPDDVVRVLRAAALRPGAELAQLDRHLRELELTDPAERLLRCLGDDHELRIVNVARHLDADRRVELLAAALRGRAGYLPGLISLIGAMWSSSLHSSVEGALRHVGTFMAPPDIAGLADALLDAGHPEAAFRLYAAAVDVVAERPVDAVVALAVALRRARRIQQAATLLDRLVAGCTSAETAVAILGALTGAGLSEADQPALAGLAQRLSDDDIITTASTLRALGRSDDALTLLMLAVGHRPPAALVTFVTRLHTDGRRIDVHRLLDHGVEIFDGHQSDELALAVGRAGLDSAAARIVTALCDRPAARVAEFLDGLDRTDPDGPLTQTVFGLIGDVDADRILNIAVELARHDRNQAARRLLRTRLHQLHTYSLGMFLHRLPVDDGVKRLPALPPVNLDVESRGAAVRRILMQPAGRSSSRSDQASVERVTFVRLIAVLLEVLPEELLDTVRTGSLHHRWLPSVLAGQAAVRRPPDLMEWFDVIHSRFPPKCTEALLTAVAGRASARDVVALVEHLDAAHGQPDLAGRLLEHCGIAGPPTLRTLYLLAWLAGQPSDRFGQCRQSWATVRNADLASLAAEAFVAAVDTTRDPHDAQRIGDGLPLTDGERLLRAWGAGAGEAVALTDRALWFGRPGTARCLPYERITAVTLADDGRLVCRTTSGDVVAVDPGGLVASELAKLLPDIATVVSAARAFDPDRQLPEADP